MPLDEVVAVLQDLNEFVVSLDRLTSRQASGTADEYTVGKFGRRLGCRSAIGARPTRLQRRAGCASERRRQRRDRRAVRQGPLLRHGHHRQPFH